MTASLQVKCNKFYVVLNSTQNGGKKNKMGLHRPDCKRKQEKGRAVHAGTSCERNGADRKS